ncbi:MAG TPA: hypothetical protein PK821_07175, partial [Victivallales bacterium]|nr:hypothetical protein [Victivallales bacterium]
MSSRIRFLLCFSLFFFAASKLLSQSADFGRPVGVLRIHVEADSEKLCSSPFDAFDPSINFFLKDQMIGASSPTQADQLKIWDGAMQNYKKAFLAGNTGDQNKDGKWFKNDETWTPSDISIQAGMGFFIKNNQTAAQNVYLSGKLPMDSSRSLTLSPSLNLFAYPFSSSINLNDSNLMLNGAKGGVDQNDSPDKISTASPVTLHWLLDNPVDPNHGKWLDSGNIPSVLKMGIGAAFWYERLGSGSFSWTENRPYQNLFDLGASCPAVTDIAFASGGTEAVLSIDCSGISGETLEIFYKDLDADEILQTESGWNIAAMGIETDSETEILWTDSGRVSAEFPFPSRPQISGIYSRIYMVSREDMDSDNDGLSNGSEKFVYGTDPLVYDSDGDGLSDGDEINVYHTDPNLVDSDGDGYSDFSEINTWNTDPKNPASNPTVMPACWTDCDVGSPSRAGS